jgi:nucleotide-binding universal stress UspA family protein
MAYKTILLCLNEIGRVPQLVEAARILGSTFNAHISGLYVIPGVQVYPAAGYAAAPDVFDGNRQHYQKHVDGVREQFETAMKSDGIRFDFHIIDSSLPMICNEVTEQGRNADLIVTSATDRKAYEGVEYDFVERLVIAAGRPVLVLPFLGEAKLHLDEVIVGWDEGREAARATFDALPLLKAAKRVRVIRIDASPRGEVQGATLAEALDRHGVNVEITNVSSDGQTTGETLLRAASDHGAGLVVIGAYGHSRFTEMIFGGVTRHIVHHLDRPVLMSH